ncbi:TonB-dependent receptor [Sphingomonas sp. ASV193]|uniref:TonB-dependent receptor n=1 Tax=Sphingomonas sp. ASV193 TaxID=3144405 RepID=UPI0032E8C075
MTITRPVRLYTLALLSTALALPATAQTAPPPVDPANQPSQAAKSDEQEIVVTATKREESLQNVPISVQALGTKKLDQLNITNFEQYTKQLPSVSFQTSAPGSTVVYMRGVATGGDGNHSGSLPSVGSYLDEQPITTIGGTLDVHIYDVARIESLAGPQGTLFGASSEAGTIRIITNKPELGRTSGRLDVDLNKVDHGATGGNIEGMINLPVSPNIAFRGSAFWQRDAGYIDNVAGTRSYAYTDGNGDPQAINVSNAGLVRKNFNPNTTYGGRAALKIDLDDNWTATPTLMYQHQSNKGVFFEDADLAPLQTQRFFPEVSREHFTQAALTVEGKIANFDITYAGAYLDRPTYSTSDYTDYTDAYNAYYQGFGYLGILDYQHYVDNAGNVIDPRQHITGTNHFRKMSHELRIASPKDNPFRVIAGAFLQRQSNDIFQNYIVDNLADSLSVPGYPGTIWLTKQKRVDRDWALFGEATYDVTPTVTLTAGGRLFKYRNTLFGFAGFGPDNPGGFSSGYNRCLTADGSQLRQGTGAALITTGGVDGTPCTNVGNVVDGKVVPRESRGHGFIHRLNAQWKPSKAVMLYATWSRGFRPGGINRAPSAPAYQPDYLTNVELGLKTTLLGGRAHWNAAVYHQIWRSFQFSFLGANSLTIIQNGRDARINGIETDANYSYDGLSLSAAAAYTDARTRQNICKSSQDPSPDCSAADDYVVAPGGTRLPVTPRFKVSANARYSWPLQSLGSANAHVQASVSHQSSAAADIRSNVYNDFAPGDYLSTVNDPNQFLGRVKASTLFDLATGLDWAKYNVEVYVANVTDERNELTRFVSCSICSRTHIVVGRPRTFGIRFGAKF